VAKLERDQQLVFDYQQSPPAEWLIHITIHDQAFCPVLK
jgi:hypothetical protein